jgi:hypothetical protein
MYMDEVLKKRGRGLHRPLSIMVHDEYKAKYDKLSVEKKVRVSEHLRQVIYPEIDRLIERLENEPPDAA